MEALFIFLLSVSIFLLFKAINTVFSSSSRPTLPPGPFSFPLIGNIQLLRTSVYDLESYVRSLCSKIGPLVTLSFGHHKLIIISDASLAHEALIQKGALFANRPPPTATDLIATCNQHNISSSYYGSNWRLFRRNLTSGILQSSRLSSNASMRKRVLEGLVIQLRKSTGQPVQVVDHFSRAMFFSLTFMCFGEQLDDQIVIEFQRTINKLASNVYSYVFLNIFPKFTRILFRQKWGEFQKLVADNEAAMQPFIRARREICDENIINPGGVLAYIDTLFSLDLPEEKRKLTDGELASLCSEFIIAAVDSTTTALQWIFANLVKHRAVQEKLYAELEEVVGKDVLSEDVIEKEQLRKMKYLKAVVLEALRLHPPAHFLLPHAVSEDVVFAGHLVPKHGSVNFLVAEIGRDPKVWEEPMEFRPERFMESEKEFDITGTKEIKMMPFGAGRRMCPGYAFALQQLEYLVANLVWRFQWEEVDGAGVDLSENRDFTVGMKNPLVVNCVARTILCEP